MDFAYYVPSSGSDNIELAKKCLALIAKIAARGARSRNPDNIGHALQELTQVLFERTGSEKILFSPIPADQIRNLRSLHDELDFVEAGSQDLATMERLLRKRRPGGTQKKGMVDIVGGMK